MRFFILASLALWACSSDTNIQPGTTTSGTGGTTTSTGGGGGVGGAATGGSGQGGATGGGGAGQGGAAGGAGGAAGGSGGATGGSGGGGDPNACVWSPQQNPCKNGFYCDAPGCGNGTCKPLGATNDAAKKPVCGCDGVHYWNAATAAAYGMSVKGPGQCPKGAFCGGFGNLQCPSLKKGGYPYGDTQYCNFDVKTKAGCNISDAGGECWGMPKKCDQIGFGGTMRNCGSQNGACAYECDAIKGQYMFFQDSNCPQ